MDFIRNTLLAPKSRKKNQCGEVKMGSIQVLILQFRFGK